MPAVSGHRARVSHPRRGPYPFSGHRVSSRLSGSRSVRHRGAGVGSRGRRRRYLAGGWAAAGGGFQTRIIGLYVSRAPSRRSRWSPPGFAARLSVRGLWLPGVAVGFSRAARAFCARFPVSGFFHPVSGFDHPLSRFRNAGAAGAVRGTDWHFRRRLRRSEGQRRNRLVAATRGRLRGRQSPPPSPAGADGLPITVAARFPRLRR